MTVAENGWAVVAKLSETKQGRRDMSRKKTDIKETDRRQTQK